MISFQGNSRSTDESPSLIRYDANQKYHPFRDSNNNNSIERRNNTEEQPFALCFRRGVFDDCLGLKYEQLPDFNFLKQSASTTTRVIDLDDISVLGESESMASSALNRLKEFVRLQVNVTNKKNGKKKNNLNSSTASSI